MPIELHSLTEGPSFMLDKPIVLVGRDLECDMRLDSRKISRRHCCMAQVGDHLVVRDLGSTNGVRINGIRVVEGYLKAGDELTIGNQLFQVRWDGMAPARPRQDNGEKAQRFQPDEDNGLEPYSPSPVPDDPLMEPRHKKAGTRHDPDRAFGMADDDDDDADDDAPMDRPHFELLPDEIGLAPGSDIFTGKPGKSK